MHRIQTRPHQIAHRLVPSVRNPHRRQLAGSVQPRQAGGIPPIGLDPIARPLRDQRRRHHDALMPPGRQATVDAIPARPRFVAKPQPRAVAAKLAQQTVQRRRRVRDPAVLPHLAAQATRRHRNDDAILVNIQPNVSDTIRHDPSPMHEARHRPTRRNPRYLHTVRRVAPYSGGHVVYQIAIPVLGSLIGSMSFTSKEVGLTDFAPQDRPPVSIPFFTFRIMVGCWLIMLLVAWAGSYLIHKERIEQTRVLL
jgi:hypothetical protein